MQPMVSKGVEPMCGWQWVYAHLHDLDDYKPTIELHQPGLTLKLQVKDAKTLREVVRAIK